MDTSRASAHAHGYFRYKGKTYLYGTVVKFNKDWLIKNGYPLFQDFYPYGERIHYGECTYGSFYLGAPSTTCNFVRFKDPKFIETFEEPCRIYTTIDPKEIENAIEEIVKPIEMVKNPRKRTGEVPEAKMLIAAYIVLMLASFIFTEPWGCWIVLTVLLVVLHKQIIDIASGNGGNFWND